MKALLYALAICSLILSGCAKKDDPQPEPADTTAPVISLKGKLKDTVSLNAVYGEPGVTAVDNTDGDISAVIVIGGNLNTNQVGDYTRKYNATDAAGNKAAEVSRMVHVKNDAAFLEGSYLAVPNCGVSSGNNYITGITVSKTVNNQVTFSDIPFNKTGQPVIGSLNSGTLITIPLITGNNYSFSGTGELYASNKKLMTLSTYSAQNSFGSYCTSQLTKQ